MHKINATHFKSTRGRNKIRPLALFRTIFLVILVFGSTKIMVPMDPVITQKVYNPGS